MNNAMQTASKPGLSLRAVLWSGATAALAVAAMGFAGSAQARDNVYWSVDVGSPGVSVGATNARPVYVQPAPIYMQPAPIYMQPAPVFIQQRPVYVQPAPVYYSRPPGWYKRHGRHGRDRDHDRDDDDDDRHDDRRGGYRKGGYYLQTAPQPYVQVPRAYQQPGYYYQR